MTDKEKLEQISLSLEKFQRIIQFKHGMAYRDECMKQRVLNTERQQVDKEEERYEN